jgi:hypothetical protein
MTVSPRSVSEGKCYATPAKPPQVRRVLTVANGQVTYEARGHKAVSGSWGSRTKVSVDTFAADVDREVNCDFDPDFGAGAT